MDIAKSAEGLMTTDPVVDYRTDPSRYRHWKLACEGPVAMLTLDVAEDGGIRPGYRLKLNSYDLGVDIELHDALNRIRFEHPEVRSVIIRSAKDRVFCSGANIFMLGLSSHAWKVNFCRFTNETRNGIEDTSLHSGIRFIAAVNGSCAGGGYELALACDEIVLVDDRSSSVSLPEVPLLGVLPGTGGLTRLTDKRKVRHDHADVLCTTTEGVRGKRAVDWRLVDALAKPGDFDRVVWERATDLAGSDDGHAPTGIALPPLEREDTHDALRHRHVHVDMDRARRTATSTVFPPREPRPFDVPAVERTGPARCPLARESHVQARHDASGRCLWRGGHEAVSSDPQPSGGG
jgi:benzoyl-CoA-dihydrodiol lyase